VADPSPGKNRKRIAQLLRMMGTNGGERRNTFAALERTLQSEGVTWTDIGDAGEHDGNGKYSEVEMQEFAQAARAEGVDEGIRIGTVRASNGSGNGHLTLPAPLEMAEYCEPSRPAEGQRTARLHRGHGAHDATGNAFVAWAARLPGIDLHSDWRNGLTFSGSATWRRYWKSGKRSPIAVICRSRQQARHRRSNGGRRSQR
jgi:hypothetical protein